MFNLMSWSPTCSTLTSGRILLSRMLPNVRDWGQCFSINFQISESYWKSIDFFGGGEGCQINNQNA